MHPKAEKILDLFRSNRPEDQNQAHELLCAIGPVEPVLLLNLLSLKYPWSRYHGFLPTKFRTPELSLQMIGWLLDAQDTAIDEKVFSLETIEIHGLDYIPSSLTRLPNATLDFANAKVECIPQWKDQTHDGVFHHIQLTDSRFLEVMEGWKFRKMTLKLHSLHLQFVCQDVHAEGHLNRMKVLLETIRTATPSMLRNKEILTTIQKWALEYRIDIIELGALCHIPPISELMRSFSKVERLWLPSLKSIVDLDLDVVHPLWQLEWNRCDAKPGSTKGCWMMLHPEEQSLRNRVYDVGINDIKELDLGALPALQSVTLAATLQHYLSHPRLDQEGNNKDNETIKFHHQGVEFGRFGVGEQHCSLRQILDLFPSVRTLELGKCVWTPKWEDVDWDATHPIESITWAESFFSSVKNDRFVKLLPSDSTRATLRERVSEIQVMGFRINMSSFTALKDIHLVDNWVNDVIELDKYPLGVNVRQSTDFYRMFSSIERQGAQEEERNHGDWSWTDKFYPYKDLTSFRITSESECRAMLKLGLPQTINRTDSRLYCIAYLLKHPEGLTYTFSQLLCSGHFGFKSSKINWLISLLTDDLDFVRLLRAVEAGLSLSRVKNRRELIEKLIDICKEKGESYSYLTPYLPKTKGKSGSRVSDSGVQTTLIDFLSMDGIEEDFSKRRRYFEEYIAERVRQNGLMVLFEDLPEEQLRALCIKAQDNEQIKYLINDIASSALSKSWQGGRSYVLREELYDFAREHTTSFLFLILVINHRTLFDGFFHKVKHRDVLIQTIFEVHKIKQELSLEMFDFRKIWKWCTYNPNVIVFKWMFEQNEIPGIALSWVKEYFSEGFSLWKYGLSYSSVATPAFFTLLQNGIQIDIDIYTDPLIALGRLLKESSNIEWIRTFVDTYFPDEETIVCPVDVSDATATTLTALFDEGRVILTGKVSVHRWVQRLIGNSALESYVKRLINWHYGVRIEWSGWSVEAIECALGLVSDGVIRLSLVKGDLEILPEAVRRLGSLEEIILYSNQLMDLPPWLDEFEHLRVISITNNPMDDVPTILKTVYANSPSAIRVYSDFVWPEQPLSEQPAVE